MKTTWIPAALLSLALTQTAFAFHHNAKEHPGKMNQLSQKLQLTPEQKASVKTLEESMRKRMRPMREESKKIDAMLHQITINAQLDEEKLNTLVKQKTTLIAEIIKNKITFKNKLYNILDPKQKEIFSNMMKSRAQMYRGKRGEQSPGGIKKQMQ